MFIVKTKDGTVVCRAIGVQFKGVVSPYCPEISTRTGRVGIESITFSYNHKSPKYVVPTSSNQMTNQNFYLIRRDIYFEMTKVNKVFFRSRNKVTLPSYCIIAKEKGEEKNQI